MFKKKDSTLKSSSKSNSLSNHTNDLALLVARMQKNADIVEKDVLRSEELLVVDAENEKKNKPFQHQKEVSDRLGEAEELLKDLFLDVDKAKKMKHPQAGEIDNDVHQLHVRWLKDCTFYRDVYEPVNDVAVQPRIDWGNVFNQKQKDVNSDQFGPGMSDLKRQIAEHNILHNEIETYNTQLSPGSTSSKEEYAAMKKQYMNLLDNSKWRRHYLNSLYDYMSGCSKEVSYLGEEQDKILKQDWSDRMIDPPDVRRQYENFKNNSLLSHESEVNRLQDDGDRLIELKHPASNTVQDQRESLRSEWQKFLNLCICQETHLDNVEDYKKYQLDADTLSESLTRLESTLDSKGLSNKSSNEVMLQLEAEEGALHRSEQLLADLRKRSTSVTPIKLRRTTPSKTTSVESLCDWTTPKASLTRGERFTLKSNSDEKNWEVVSTDGVTKTFPGVCFLIPGPDPEAIDKVNLLGNELEDLKKRRAAVRASLKNHKPEASRAQRAAPVSTAPENPKAVEIAGQLDKMDQELAQAEQDMLNRLRAPLDRKDPSRDLANRLKEQEKAAAALKQMQQQKAATQNELAPLMAKDSPVSSSLSEKLNAAANKQDSLAALADLYSKKARASIDLENQINKVDDKITSFEKRLSNDGVISDAPNAIQAQAQEIQNIKRDVTAAQGDMQKMNQDLQATEQLCRSLQQGYQEYCPDISRQEAKVKSLQNRYTNVSNQTQERERLLQEAASKNQDFQKVSQSLNSFMNNLPDNKIHPRDDIAQINAKQASQERLMEDITRKEDDMDRVADLSQDLQSILNEYEMNCDKYNATLDSDVVALKRPRTSALADSVEKQEKALMNQYAKTSAENGQLLNQMGTAKSILVQNEEKVALVSQQRMQLQSQQRNDEEVASLQRELQEEMLRRNHAENDLSTFKTRMVSLKSRRGVERVEEKEVLQYYRDPKLETDLSDLQNKAHEEALKRTGIQTEVELISKNITHLETELKTIKPKLVTREVTQFEKDPQLDVEAARLREEITKLKDEVRLKNSEEVHLKTEVTILEQKRPTIKEKVVKKEVVKTEKDPEMLKAVITFKNDISGEAEVSKSLNNQIFQVRSQINNLERLIPSLEPKIVTKEVKKVEQDPETINESKRLRSGLDEERYTTETLERELRDLQSRHLQLEQLRPKVEIKEIVNEIYRVAPETEAEISRIRRELQSSSEQSSGLDRQIKVVQTDLNAVRAQKPKVEFKEVIQEVVKEERSPENVREIQKLQNQVYNLQSAYNNSQDQCNRYTKERDEWKIEKSKVETKLVTKDVVKYVDDPLLEKEADRLRRELRDETQRRRTTEEMVFDLQNKYIQLERQKPEEKVVVQEVVRLQKDPRQMQEHERLGKSLDEEAKSRRKMDLEVQQLRTLVQDKERSLRDSDERQRKIQVETELRQVKTRIYELEHAPPPIEEKIVIEQVLKVERDPKLEKLTNGLRINMDKESSDITRLERDIRNVKLKLDILQREKTVEKTVYKEVIRVEKDQAVEAERNHLRDQVLQEKNARRDLEDEIRRLKEKLHRLDSKTSSSSWDESNLSRNRDTLQRERDNLLRELRTLESEKQNSSISFQQQSRLMSERNQMSRQKSIKMETDIQRLEREILDEKDKIYKRESTARELMSTLRKEDTADTRTKETNVSTKISILDPDTGKDMSPYDAYMQGLIDRAQYIHLQELECDWEEITTMGPDGETSVLQDRKSGKQYSIKNALRDGRLTQYQLEQYRNGKMPISEFALLVAGETKRPSAITPVTNQPISHAPPYTNSISPKNDKYPISGILDVSTNTCVSVRSAMVRRLIDSNTAQRLLEAQASTGGIVDINNKERYPVHKAADRGLIESSQLQRLLNAQKAFAGVEDPVTRERLSVGEAVQKGWMPKDTAMRYLEAQHLTGGLIDPNRPGKMSTVEAIGAKMIDSAMLRELQEESNYAKDLIDPITKEKLNYKQAMARCKVDPVSGLLMLPASSNDAPYVTPYFSHRSSTYNAY